MTTIKDQTPTKGSEEIVKICQEFSKINDTAGIIKLNVPQTVKDIDPANCLKAANSYNTQKSSGLSLISTLFNTDVASTQSNALPLISWAISQHKEQIIVSFFQEGNNINDIPCYIGAIGVDFTDIPVTSQELTTNLRETLQQCKNKIKYLDGNKERSSKKHRIHAGR